jgi:hypothetical protein
VIITSTPWSPCFFTNSSGHPDADRQKKWHVLAWVGPPRPIAIFALHLKILATKNGAPKWAKNWERGLGPVSLSLTSSHCGKYCTIFSCIIYPALFFVLDNFPANFLFSHKIVWYSCFDSDRIGSASSKWTRPFILYQCRCSRLCWVSVDLTLIE